MSSDNNGRWKTKLEAFSVMVGWSKLIITIAAGALALSVTFFRAIEEGNHPLRAPWMLALSWGAFLTTMVFGAILIGKISAYLSGAEPDKLDTQQRDLLRYSFIHWIAFLLGIGLFSAFGIFNLFKL